MPRPSGMPTRRYELPWGESPTVRIDTVFTPGATGSTYGSCELLGPLVWAWARAGTRSDVSATRSATSDEMRRVMSLLLGLLAFLKMVRKNCDRAPNDAHARGRSQGPRLELVKVPFRSRLARTGSAPNGGDLQPAAPVTLSLDAPAMPSHIFLLLIDLAPGYGDASARYDEPPIPRPGVRLRARARPLARKQRRGASHPVRPAARSSSRCLRSRSLRVARRRRSCVGHAWFRRSDREIDPAHGDSCARIGYLLPSATCPKASSSHPLPSPRNPDAHPAATVHALIPVRRWLPRRQRSRAYCGADGARRRPRDDRTGRERHDLAARRHAARRDRRLVCSAVAHLPADDAGRRAVRVRRVDGGGGQRGMGPGQRRTPARRHGDPDRWRADPRHGRRDRERPRALHRRPQPELDGQRRQRLLAPVGPRPDRADAGVR